MYINITGSCSIIVVVVVIGVGEWMGGWCLCIKYIVNFINC